MKYIIDTDPGIDDSIAISMAIKNNLDIIGFTLATGNIPQVKSEKNLKVVQEILGTNIKMYKGEEEKEVKHETAEYAHGIDGLGYYLFPDISRKKYEKMKAEDFIIKASKKYKDDLTLICFGSLVNLANAIRKDKNLVKRLKHVLIMGATYNPEDETPYMEFNINASPTSAKLVLSSPFEDIKLVTHEIGLDAHIDRDYVLNLKESTDTVSRFVGLIAHKYMDFSAIKYGDDGLVNPDPATVASVIDPSILKFEPCSVKVIDRGGKKGECYVALTDESNIKVATEIRLNKFTKLFKDTFK